jgi:hypothetical protein
MTELAGLTAESFGDLLGDRFEVTAGGAPTELCLTEVVALGPAPPGARAPFSLVFTGSADGIRPQGIYALEHETLGRLELFLVPLAPDGTSARYQAIFS